MIPTFAKEFYPREGDRVVLVHPLTNEQWAGTVTGPGPFASTVHVRFDLGQSSWVPLKNLDWEI